MHLTFLTPLGALAGLVAIVPVAALLLRERRAGRLRDVLGLHPPGALARLPSALALAAVALLAVAASQPAVAVEEARLARTDAQIFFVFDISRSMLATASPGGPTRFARALDLGERLRADLSDVPAGVASLTDRALPHLLPTPDEAAFGTVLRRALAVNRPPPMDEDELRATDLEVIRFVATEGYFAQAAKRRLVVVLTDGESEELSPIDVAAALETERVDPILVHVWRADERVYGRDGRPEPYRADPRSRADLAAVAAETGGKLYGENDRDRIVAAAREFLGEGPTIPVGSEERVVRLAPYAVLAAAALLLVQLGSVWLVSRAGRNRSPKRSRRVSTSAGSNVSSSALRAAAARSISSQATGVDTVGHAVARRE